MSFVCLTVAVDIFPLVVKMCMSVFKVPTIKLIYWLLLERNSPTTSGK